MQIAHMSIRHPPRKEPRVLSLGTMPHGLVFAVVDPWVIRSAGRTRCREPSRSAAMLRLIRREKPTAVVVAEAALVEAAGKATQLAGIAFVGRRSRKIPIAIARELYPELPLFAPGRLGRVAALGISTVLNCTPTSRNYASTRHRAAQRRSQ